MWRAVSRLPDRGARVELISLLLLLLFHFMFGFSCQTLTQYPSVSWIIEIFDCKFGQESNIVKSNFMITQSCRTYFKWILSIPNNLLTFSQWTECKLEESVWQMTADNICLMLPHDPPQQYDSQCVSQYILRAQGGNEKTNHQCKHQSPLSNWRISRLD